MKKQNAYWISPKGQVIDTPISHIKTILGNPNKFGLTKDYLVKKYAEYNERIGIEGKARGEIMIDLMKRGWIRIRYILKKDSWTIQTYYFGNREKNNIWDWVRDARKSNVAYQYADLRILITKSGRVIDSSFSDAVKGKKLFEYKKELSFFDIVMMKQEGTMQDINEASLGRAYQHYKKSKEDGFGIITSWRTGNTKKKNFELWKKLQQDVRSQGLGYFKLEGHWVECQDPNVSYDECPKNELIASIEPALFIPGMSLILIKKLTKKYDQDASVYSGPETKGKMELVYRDGTTQNIGNFHPNKVAQAYSKLRGRTFTFEGFSYPAQNYMEGLIEENFKLI